VRRLLDLWARVHRNARAISAAVLIWAAVFFMWSVKCHAERDPVVDRVQERGMVLEVLGTDPVADGGLQLRPVVIQLADSTQIQLVVPTPLPKAGDRVPLRVEVHRSGKRTYSFDAQEWLITGPS
jgi:hypothetical protein